MTNKQEGMQILNYPSLNAFLTSNQITLGGGQDGSGFKTVINSAAPSADRILSIPALTANDSIALLDQAQTLTNKTLTNPIIESAIRTTSTSFSVFNTTATTIFAFGGTTTCNIGYSSTDNSTINISTGAVASTKTKTINIGTGGVAGSTTNVNIGSSIAGSTTINSTTLLGAATTQNIFNTVATTINAFGAAATATFGYVGTDNSTTNFATGVNASGKTKYIYIGGGGASGSTTNISIGSSTSGSSNNIGLNGLINGYLSTPPNISGLNGTWLGWNSVGLGESIFANFRQGGTGGFDFRIYANDASLISTPLQIKESSVNITVAGLNFTNATAAAISFGVGGANPPSFTTRSTGTKAVYYQTLSTSSVDYARGIASATLWDSIPQATSGYSYKLFGGTTQILQVRGDGLMTLAGNFAAKNIVLESDSTYPSIKFKESGFNDTAGVFFYSSGLGDSNYLGLTGSSSNLDPADQTLGFKVTQSGKCLAASRTAGLGYELGVSITQATSKSTTISSNNLSGTITTHNAALAAVTTVNFTFTNTAIAVGDHILFSHIGGGTLGNYLAQGVCADGSATISLRNLTSGSLSDAVQLKFTILKGANA